MIQFRRNRPVKKPPVTTSPRLTETSMLWTTDKLLIHGCPRCRQTHEITWHKFGMPLLDSKGKIEFTHWATCPVSGEPLLILVKDEAARMESLQEAVRDHAKGRLSLLGMESKIGWWG